MKGKRQTYIALLRGINVTGKNMIPMADLRTFCTKDGLENVTTYIASGNIVFSSTESQPEVESRLEKLITKRFGLTIPVIVRTGSQWPDYIKGNPFPKESETESKAIQLALPKRKPLPGLLDGIKEKVTNGERVALVGDGLWIHFPNSIAGSKLSPALLDRLAGSPMTSRNWRTVLKLGELSKEAE